MYLKAAMVQGTPFHAGGREPLGKIPTSVPIEAFRGALRGVQGPSPWSDPGANAVLARKTWMIFVQSPFKLSTNIF